MSWKTGYVAMLGLPNAGKSTLTNTIIGEKVSIITAKPQTTRQRVLGIWTEGNFQAVLMDSPGRIEAATGLNAFLTREYKRVVGDSDLIVTILNVDANRLEDLLRVVDEANKSGKLAAVVITKTDLPETPGRRNQLQKAIREAGIQVPFLEFSKKWNPTEVKEFRDKLKALLSTRLPEAEQPLYDQELYTPHSIKELVAEIVREKCFEQLHQEVPFGIGVAVLKYTEGDDLDRIEVEILVSQDSHKPIVLGKGGSKIKQIGQEARAEIEKIAGRKVFLGLQVKAKAGWDLDQRTMKGLGYWHE